MNQYQRQNQYLANDHQRKGFSLQNNYAPIRGSRVYGNGRKHSTSSLKSKSEDKRSILSWLWDLLLNLSHLIDF